MITTYAERYLSRRYNRGVSAPVGPSVAVYGVVMPAIPVVMGLAGVCLLGSKIAATWRWLNERQDVQEISDGIREFLAEEEELEQQDGAMTGEEIYLDRTKPVVVTDSSALVSLESGYPVGLVPGPTSFVCVRCKTCMDVTDSHLEVTCSMCGYGPIVVRAGRKKRYCRGHFNMIRDAIKEFPQRMEHPNRRLAEQQVYTYMLRRSKELRWTVKDQTTLPALAAMAFLVRSRGEIDARKMAQSAFAEAAAYEYEMAGSRYPNFKRVLDSLKFFV